MAVELTVNGQRHAVEVEARMTLLDCLRDRLGLTGVHAGCEHGVCGACTVLVDSVAVRSCLMFTVQADGYAITTIEGLTPAPGELSPLQDAFCETHGMQCGYCTPAMILTAHALLASNPAPTREEIVEAISANICRCTGYAQIVEAIALAAERMRGSNQPMTLP
jgi:carbon-monoxide dehydrogenase small subunit